MPRATRTTTRDRLLTIQEVADYLGVAVQTLYNWRHLGLGPKAVKVGRALRYRESAVAAWVDAHTG